MKRYFFHLDNILCKTDENDYNNSTPFQEIINFLNTLKENDNHITIWTTIDCESFISHKELTIKQLNDWGVKYDELLLGKPNYDNIDSIFPLPFVKTKKQSIEIVEKGWGKEIIIINNSEYCGKILCFKKGKKFSMHYHLLKKETWYVSKGKFILIWIDTNNGINYTEYLNIGDTITNERGHPHQLLALEDGEIFEISTKHHDNDSYRILKGD
jgi:mannose-6-phosphate isomerase-like protein (cupin superfamily)